MSAPIVVHAEGLGGRRLCGCSRGRGFAAVYFNVASFGLAIELFTTDLDGHGVAIHIGPFSVLAGMLKTEATGEDPA